MKSQIELDTKYFHDLLGLLICFSETHELNIPDLVYLLTKTLSTIIDVCEQKQLLVNASGLRLAIIRYLSGK